MVAPAFFWKLLSLEGFHPILDTCTRCGDEADPFQAFDFGEGGVLCGECARFAGRRVDAEAIALLRRILGGDLRGALTAPPERPGIEVERLGVAALEYHLERRLRSAALL
jgi:DNA repair protein RecO (recombination protein O)